MILLAAAVAAVANAIGFTIERMALLLLNPCGFFDRVDPGYYSRPHEYDDVGCGAWYLRFYAGALECYCGWMM